MPPSPFPDQAHAPTADDLRTALGKAHAAWVRLIELVETRIPPITQVWRFSGAKTGWGLRLRRHERVILYMTPGSGQFLVSFALGEKAVGAARSAKLPRPVLAAIEAAPRYAEGRGVRFEVRQSRQIPPLAILAEIKNDH